MTPLEKALRDIRARAGVPRKEVAVYFAAAPQQPPTRVTRRGRTKSRCREVTVEVGKDWLRTRAPKTWAALVFARLEGTHILPQQLHHDWYTPND